MNTAKKSNEQQAQQNVVAIMSVSDIKAGFDLVNSLTAAAKTIVIGPNNQQLVNEVLSEQSLNTMKLELALILKSTIKQAADNINMNSLASTLISPTDVNAKIDKEGQKSEHKIIHPKSVIPKAKEQEKKQIAKQEELKFSLNDIKERCDTYENFLKEIDHAAENNQEQAFKWLRKLGRIYLSTTDDKGNPLTKEAFESHKQKIKNVKKYFESRADADTWVMRQIEKAKEKYSKKTTETSKTDNNLDQYNKLKTRVISELKDGWNQKTDKGDKKVTGKIRPETQNEINNFFKSQDSDQKVWSKNALEFVKTCNNEANTKTETKKEQKSDLKVVHNKETEIKQIFDDVTTRLVRLAKVDGQAVVNGLTGLSIALDKVNVSEVEQINFFKNVLKDHFKTEEINKIMEAYEKDTEVDFRSDKNKIPQKKSIVDTNNKSNVEKSSTNESSTKVGPKPAKKEDTESNKKEEKSTIESAKAVVKGVVNKFLGKNDGNKKSDIDKKLSENLSKLEEKDIELKFATLIKEGNDTEADRIANLYFLLKGKKADEIEDWKTVLRAQLKAEAEEEKTRPTTDTKVIDKNTVPDSKKETVKESKTDWDKRFQDDVFSKTNYKKNIFVGILKPYLKTTKNIDKGREYFEKFYEKQKMKKEQVHQMYDQFLEKNKIEVE